jgi:hypothetical protein
VYADTFVQHTVADTPARWSNKNMPLHPALDKPEILNSYYRMILNHPDKTRRDEVLKRRFELLCSRDPHMQSGNTDGEMYYKALAQGVRDKVLPTLIDALDRGVCPELHITLKEGQDAAVALGYSRFGSPQDFLYGFTSERYVYWSSALAGMGFKSAVMVGSQHAVLTMAPRNLDFSKPDKKIDELAGAVASDFWETSALTGSRPVLKEMLDYLCKTYKLGEYPAAATKLTITTDLTHLNGIVGSIPIEDGYAAIVAKMAEEEIEKIHKEFNLQKQLKKYNDLLAETRPERPKQKQEQIVLKYVADGNLLQKLLGGRRVDHIQSNVKNQKNPWRQSGCEVDSIYRVVGDKSIVLVEAKAGNAISRSQLYQIYETYRLKLPKAWEILVVGVLLSDPVDNEAESVQVVIDMAEIEFDDKALGRVTESIINMSLGRHYRWLIHRDQPQVI